MAESDIYEELREKLNLFPVRVPRTKELMEMLKVVYTPEEAEFLAHFSAPLQNPETIDQIVKKTGKPREKIQEIIEGLVSRGLLYRFKSSDGTIYYTLPPIVPGFDLYYFSSGRDSDEKRKAAKLFDKYFTDSLGVEMGASNYPWARVMPSEKTITVDKEISADLIILPFEKMSEFIKTSRCIAVINCSCRTIRKCNHPLETCLVFGAVADFMVENGYGHYLSVEQALELLEKMEEAGLVHNTMNIQARPTFICSCCSCACIILRNLVELHNPRAFAKSNFLPVMDDEICTKCKKCVNICPTHARVYHASHDNEPERILFLEERCIGCGLCAYHCSNGATKLVKVRDQIPEKTPAEAFVRVEAERIH
nr:4Fe-4S dicluster domain-containing protein [Candidatus Freyarchaeota archaeon]